MTFAEYNTDANFDDNNSSLDELVKIGVAEGKNEDEIRNSLSAKWKNSKKINELSSYYQKHFANKNTPKAEEKKTVEAPKTEPKTVLTGDAADYANKQNKIADAAGEMLQDDIKKNSDKNWEELYNSSLKRAEGYRNIDDHYIENLPKTIRGAYKAGEFGEVGSKEAKQRLAYFVMDNFANVLKTFSNAAAANAGRAPMFTDIESQWDKMQKTNLANAMENRWQKYKSDTEGAIKAVEKEFGNEQDARLAAEQFTRDKKANTYWNMMDQDQKIYALQVSKEIGDYVGNMDLGELANFIAGSALTGDMSKDEVVAIGIAKLAAETPELLKNLPEGDIKTKVLAMISSVSGNKVPDLKEVVAGVGGAGNETPNNPDSIIDEKKTNSKVTNPMGNLKGYKALDGKTYDWSTWEDKEGKNDLLRLTQDLSDKFYNGEIDAATFMTYYEPLYKEGGKHIGVKINAPSDVMKANVEKKLKDLNKETKSGKVTVDDYGTKTAEIIAMAQSAGLSAGEIEKLKKDFIDSSKIKYKGPLAK